MSTTPIDFSSGIYTIWIVSPKSFPVAAKCFAEIAEVLHQGLEQLGYQAFITDNPLEAKGVCIALAARAMYLEDRPLPDNLMVYNLEQLDRDLTWTDTSIDKYIHTLRQYPVWDYSPNSIAYLNELGIKVHAFCPLGYAPNLTRITPAPVKDIDVLFYGTQDPRRSVIINALKERGVTAEHLCGVYGHARDAYTARSKIVLNMHKKPAAIFEIARVSYLLANKVCVVSESGKDRLLEEAYQDAVAFYDYNALVDGCIELLQDADRQTQLAEQGFKAMQSMQQKDYLAQAIMQHQMVEQSDSSQYPLPWSDVEYLSYIINPATMPPHSNPASDMTTVTTTSDTLLICLSAADNDALHHTVSSLMEQAKDKSRLRIAVAWHGTGPIELLDRLGPGAAKLIDIKHVSNQQMVGNAYKDAMSLWQREVYVAWVPVGASAEKHWDASLHQALAGLEKQTLLTSAVGNGESKSACIVAAMADKVTTPLLIRIDHTDAEVSEQLLTPLCGPLLAGRAEDMFACMPDPYMDSHTLDLTHSARLWTHGIRLAQPSQPICYGAVSQNAEVNDRALERAQHLLGLAYTERETTLIDLDLYGHGDARDVDEFWRAVGVNIQQRQIHPDALKGQWEKLLASRVKLNSKQMLPISSQILSMVDDQRDVRIFVQIPSYRDDQCQYTVQDLFAKASYPDRISVGICWQSVPEEDQDCFRIITRPQQVHVVHYDARQSKGANWARVEAGKLRKDEEYTLMIDAHTRFEKGWDQLLINMYQQLPAEKSIISTYPTGFDPKTGKCKDDHILRMAYKEFIKVQSSGVHVVKYRSHRIPKANWPDRPFPAATLSSNFLFVSSNFFEEVPLDPYIYFFGDDLDLMVRAWTHGWNVFSPNMPVLYHLWDRKSRPLHWVDQEETDKRVQLTERRVAHITGMHKRPTHAPAVEEIDKYGLGGARSLREFETFAGLSFKNKVLADHAIRGVYSYQPREVIATRSMASGLQPVRNAEPFVNPQRPLIMQKKNGPILPLIQPGNTSGPIKTYESSEIIVYDNFLPEDDFSALYDHATMADYRHINTTGNVTRVWNIDNGFPLRSSWNRYYRVPGSGSKKTDEDYPKNEPTDKFVECLNQIAPDVQHLIGTPGIHWAHYSMTSWLYPQNTGLSLHNDGEAYSGAYVYYLNKEWRIHWGGLLLVMDSVANEAMEQHKVEYNPHEFHRNKWLNETEHNNYAMEAGFARTVFPKRNRIVFISPEAYHIVTKILPAAGDNVRTTLAGFFNRGPLGKKKEQQQPSQHPLEMHNKS